MPWILSNAGSSKSNVDLHIAATTSKAIAQLLHIRIWKCRSSSKRLWAPPAFCTTQQLGRQISKSQRKPQLTLQFGNLNHKVHLFILSWTLTCSITGSKPLINARKASEENLIVEEKVKETPTDVTDNWVHYCNWDCSTWRSESIILNKAHNVSCDIWVSNVDVSWKLRDIWAEHGIYRSICLRAVLCDNNNIVHAKVKTKFMRKLNTAQNAERRWRNFRAHSHRLRLCHFDLETKP